MRLAGRHGKCWLTSNPTEPMTWQRGAWKRNDPEQSRALWASAASLIGEGDVLEVLLIHAGFQVENKHVVDAGMIFGRQLLVTLVGV
jgi:hypothetical protein